MKQRLGQIVWKTASGTNRLKDSVWDKSFKNQRLGQIIWKPLLAQIVWKTASGTNRLKNSVWDKSFEKQCLGQVVWKPASGTNLQSGTNPLKNNVWDGTHRLKISVWDKSFEKLRLRQVVWTPTSGTNRLKTSVWNKSFEKQRLGQIIWKRLVVACCLEFCVRAVRYGFGWCRFGMLHWLFSFVFVSYLVFCRLWVLSGLLIWCDFWNNVWNKSFKKQRMGQIIWKTVSVRDLLLFQNPSQIQLLKLSWRENPLKNKRRNETKMDAKIMKISIKWLPKSILKPPWT